MLKCMWYPSKSFVSSPMAAQCSLHDFGRVQDQPCALQKALEIPAFARVFDIVVHQVPRHDKLQSVSCPRGTGTPNPG